MKGYDCVMHACVAGKVCRAMLGFGKTTEEAVITRPRMCGLKPHYASQCQGWEELPGSDASRLTLDGHIMAIVEMFDAEVAMHGYSDWAYAIAHSLTDASEEMLETLRK